MIVDARRFAAVALDALHESVDVRRRGLRVGLHHGRNVATDYALLDQAAPFLHRLQRCSITIVLDGTARFEEGVRRAYLREGDLAVSHSSLGGTEAFAGAVGRRLVLDWEPEIAGVPIAGTFSIGRLGTRDRARLREAGDRLGSARPAEAVEDVLAILRSLGFRFEALEPEADDHDDASLQSALGARISKLDEHPALDDVAGDLGWNQRRVHRRLASVADRYGLNWTEWRSTLHSARLLWALGLSAAPGATTELVARLAGFRSPTALCHAFADAGWPAPGALARASRADVLARWAELARSPGIVVAAAPTDAPPARCA